MEVISLVFTHELSFISSLMLFLHLDRSSSYHSDPHHAPIAKFNNKLNLIIHITHA